MTARPSGPASRANPEETLPVTDPAPRAKRAPKSIPAPAPAPEVAPAKPAARRATRVPRTSAAGVLPAAVAASEAVTAPRLLDPAKAAALTGSSAAAATAKVRASRARRAAVPDDRSALDVARRIVELAEDKKAADIVLLDLSAMNTISDCFVICSGGSERQLDAIAGGIIDGLRAEGIRPIGREGTAASHWVLVDFGVVIVHIFTPPDRDFYQLEKLWSEARTVLRVQ
jgi:ribosome-associated protein